MKILIYMPFSDWVPFFATDLEIAVLYLKKGDEVHVIQCSGDLHFCEPNPMHLRLRCTLCKLCRDRGLNIINFPKRNIHEINLRAFSRNIEIPEFSSLQELKDFKVDNVDIGMTVASSLISMVRENNPDLNLYKNYIRKNLLMAIAIYDAITSHLKGINPDKFYLFNGRLLPLRPALRAAQHLGIKTYVHETAGVFNKYNLTEDTFPHDLEYQKNQIEKCWEKENSLSKKEKIAAKWYEERRDVSDHGWLSYTKSQIKGTLPKGFNFEKRNVAIFNSSEDEFESIEGWQNPIYKNQTEALQNIVNSKLEENIVLYLRVHPNLKGLNNTQMRELAELKASNLVIIPADSKIDSYQLLQACEKVLTFGSTIGIESVFWGKPSILIGRALYEGIDACYIPKSHEELIDLINQHLYPKEKSGSLKYAYWEATKGYPFVYYSPESIRMGKFMGVYLKNPIIKRIKEKILSFDLASKLIFNFAYFMRTLIWEFKRIR